MLYKFCNTAKFVHGCMAGLGDYDLKAARNEYFFRAPSVMTSVLKDERDRPIFYLFFNCSLFVAAGSVVIHHTNSHAVGVVYFVLLFTQFFERFVLALHNATHRSIFVMPLANQLPEFVMAPFFGIPAGLYRTHHISIHHVHGNMFPWDVSSTEPYQRDRVLHLIFYCINFVFCSLATIPLSFLKQGKAPQAAYFVSVLFCNILAISSLSSLYPVPVFWLLTAPLCLAPFLLAYGNYCQHIFIDPDKPESDFGMTYSLVDCAKNQMVFNDGYHIEHHINSVMHWTELPSRFQKRLPDYKEHNALIFRGHVSFFIIGKWVFTQNYDCLYQNLVQLNEPKQSRDEVEKMLRKRLKPVSRWGDGAVIKDQQTCRASQ